MYSLILFAYLMSIGIATIIHYAALSSIKYRNQDNHHMKFLTLPTRNGDNMSVFWDVLKYAISSDFWSAYSFKKNIVKPDELKEFIKNSNLYNLIFSSLLIFYYIIASPQNTLFKYFIYLRVISRSFEIMIAFYKDVIDNRVKNSSLKPNDRMKLAVRSYLEVIILNALLYRMFKEHDIFGGVFKSIGVSTFTGVDFCSRNPLLLNSFIALQLFTSLCLVSFALARYIGEK